MSYWHDLPSLPSELDSLRLGRYSKLEKTAQSICKYRLAAILQAPI
jgi:hypothetical protein